MTELFAPLYSFLASVCSFLGTGCVLFDAGAILWFRFGADKEDYLYLYKRPHRIAMYVAIGIGAITFYVMSFKLRP